MIKINVKVKDNKHFQIEREYIAPRNSPHQQVHNLACLVGLRECFIVS
jgi:hypothetical protein